ncbi:hypothetical protein BCD67_14980 [Oscillatoriales cyanobacterium USR001]|nr:hypothetical protein BCD67_14980 [Oscillatoriales cyanobacterium USR001]
MSEIRFKLAKYLEDHCLTPEKLINAVGTDTSPAIIYQLVKHGNEQRQIDLSTLASIVQGLGKLTGLPIGIEDVLEFVPETTDIKNNPWQEFDSEENLPYEWGEINPMKNCKPVRYVEGIGLIVDSEEVEESLG